MSEPPPLHLSDCHKKWIRNVSSFNKVSAKKAAIVSQMPPTILKREDPFQALIKQQAYFQEIQAKQQMEFQKQMMEFLKSKRIHE